MSSALQISKSVLSIARQCAALFGRALSSQSLGKQTRIDLENQLGRFKIWAGNIGVFAARSASLDYRLRNDEDVKEIMVQMLTRLWRTIEQLVNPPLVEMQTAEDSESNQSDSSSSSSSLVVSLDADSEASSSTRPPGQLEDYSPDRQIQTVDSIITRLYRLSAIIRKPTSFSENAKVTKFIDKAPDGGDMEEYISHIRWQIQFRFPDTSPVLAERLVNAVVFRRKKLMYRERHQYKLNQGVDDAFGLDMLVPNSLDGPKAQGRDVIKVPRHSSPFLKVAATVKSSSQTVPFSATQASSVNRQGLASYAKSSTLSGITKSAVARRDQLDVPPPPRPENETEEAVCPYCFEIVDKGKMVRAQWARHILKDIDPYVCLFEDCNKPNEHFKTVENWVSHMKWQHTMVWSCQASRHKSELFDSKERFELHMRQEHKDDFAESQLEMLIQKSAHPASDLFSILARQSIDNISENWQQCPLCPFSSENANARSNQEPSLLGADLLPDEGDKIIRNHIAAHLESIALLSLPEQNDLDNAASNELQSQSAKNSSREDDENLPAAVFDDPVILIEDHEANLESEQYQDSLRAQGQPPVTVEWEDWEYIFSQFLKRDSYPEPEEDPTLRGFFERARQIQIMLMRQNSKIPVLVVSNPDGLEVAVIYDDFPEQPEGVHYYSPEQLDDIHEHNRINLSGEETTVE